MTKADYTPGQWQSDDGLKLHYRDYPGRDDRPPLLCIPGLTRNARDFEPVADAFAGEWRVICIDLRGRGDSDYAKDSATYMPLQYVADLQAFFAQTGIERVIAVGTSLGGLVTMMLAMQSPERLAGAVINDIGPVIETTGLDRIKDYVGQGRSHPTWMHAARALRETSAAAYPDFDLGEWLVLAKRLMCVGNSGRIAFDYDMKIAEPFAAAGAQTAVVDMWPAWRALGGRPVLALRGELSDLLSAQTFARMGEEVSEAELVEIPRVGHAPTLDEPAAQAAIARLLAKVA